ncbi:hypothetical protein J4E08_05340 [Sagittula sp. NFXS13]|uniref:Uncharacterized protein n=1 Tax=Sagittula marina TaxID=943940 RepID=A0A7W6GS88_9RHOB|nr:hypothetical protein [Sagittula marina]MBB3983884.1 hypothetical protein [Sagittula marina]
MRIGAVIAAIIAVVVIGFGIYMIDIDQTEEGSMPEVSVEGGNLPEFDAEVGDVDVTEEEVTVTVPEIEVTPPEDDNN